VSTRTRTWRAPRPCVPARRISAVNATRARAPARRRRRGPPGAANMPEPVSACRISRSTPPRRGVRRRPRRRGSRSRSRPAAAWARAAAAVAVRRSAGTPGAASAARQRSRDQQPGPRAARIKAPWRTPAGRRLSR
jgi:hypothetical protein